MLNELAARCRRELNGSVVPFWLEHSLNRACGGYFSALGRDGGVYDTRKYMWLQGRAVWMFARLYNEWDRRPEYLEAARLGADYIRTFGRDDQGRLYFSLTFPDPRHGEWFGYCDRQGNPTHTCKGGNYKGFFHVPRALLFCAQRIEKTHGASPGRACVATPNADCKKA